MCVDITVVTKKKHSTTLHVSSEIEMSVDGHTANCLALYHHFLQVFPHL